MIDWDKLVERHKERLDLWMDKETAELERMQQSGLLTKEEFDDCIKDLEYEYKMALYEMKGAV